MSENIEDVSDSEGELSQIDFTGKTRMIYSLLLRLKGHCVVYLMK